jgi:hypothetical protein
MVGDSARSGRVVQHQRPIVTQGAAISGRVAFLAPLMGDAALERLAAADADAVHDRG